MLGLLLWRRRVRRQRAAPATAPSRFTLQHSSNSEGEVGERQRRKEATEVPLSAALKADKGPPGASTQLGSIYVDGGDGGAEGADFQIGSMPAAGEEEPAAVSAHGSGTAGLPGSHATTSGEPDSLAQLMSGLPATPGGLTTAASLGPAAAGPVPPDALAVLAGELAAQEEALQHELEMLQHYLAQGQTPAAADGLPQAEEQWFTPASSLASGSPSPAASAASPPPSPTHRHRSTARRGTPTRPGSAARPGSSSNRRQTKVSPVDSPSPDTGGAAQPPPGPPVWLDNQVAGIAREQASEEEAGGRGNVALRRLSSAVRKMMSQGGQP